MKTLIDWIERRVIGLDRSAIQVLLASAFNGRDILLLGRHGLGKSTIARCLAEVLQGEWVHYDASKDDLVSIAGLPDAESMRAGGLSFVEHNRTIWNKEVVLLEEITRANKENQNMWLEVLEQRRLFGISLPCKVFIATCNPESYAATYQLDDALLDRFPIVFSMDDLQEGTRGMIQRMVDINLRIPQGSISQEALKTSPDIYAAIAKARSGLLQDSALLNTIAQWCEVLLGIILSRHKEKGEGRYISPRTYGNQLPNILLDLIAFDCALGHALTAETVAKQAELAVRYSLQTKCRLDAGIVTEAIKEARTVILEWAGATSVQNFDALAGLDSGDLARRINCLEGLLNTPSLLAEHGPQLDAKVRGLMGDAMRSDDLALSARLWQVCERLPQVRPELEIEMLKSRLETLLTSTEVKPRQQPATRRNLVKNMRYKTMQVSQWTPAHELWGKI